MTEPDPEVPLTRLFFLADQQTGINTRAAKGVYAEIRCPHACKRHGNRAERYENFRCPYDVEHEGPHKCIPKGNYDKDDHTFTEREAVSIHDAF